MRTPRWYIFDFDSTLVSVESLDMLARRVLELKSPAERDGVLQHIEEITARGMRGVLPFSQSLSERTALFSAHKREVQTLASDLVSYISPSVLRAREFFTAHREQIYIISGGFTELILPVAQEIGLNTSHVRANAFVYSQEGYVVAVDTSRPTAQDHGKAKQLAALELSGFVTVVGDGYTDYEMKLYGGADRFVAYTEHAAREPVVEKADQTVSSFDAFLASE